MPAPKGNKYNEKWILDEAVELFENLLVYLKENDEIVYINDLVIKYDLSRDTFYYLLDKFKDLHKLKAEIDFILENRIVNNGLSNKSNSTFSIFFLKNKYGWKDKQEVEQNISGLNIYLPKKDGN